MYTLTAYIGNNTEEEEETFRAAEGGRTVSFVLLPASLFCRSAESLKQNCILAIRLPDEWLPTPLPPGESRERSFRSICQRQSCLPVLLQWPTLLPKTARMRNLTKKLEDQLGVVT